jgi:hypothetical protein
MKVQKIFPKLPVGLTTFKLRLEIRRRIEVMDRLGLIKKPKK